MIQYCLYCGDPMVPTVHKDQPVLLCYTCEVMIPMETKESRLTPEFSYARIQSRGNEGDVSRSALLAA